MQRNSKVVPIISRNGEIVTKDLKNYPQTIRQSVFFKFLDNISAQIRGDWLRPELL